MWSTAEKGPALTVHPWIDGLLLRDAEKNTSDVDVFCYRDGTKKELVSSLEWPYSDSSAEDENKAFFTDRGILYVHKCSRNAKDLSAFFLPF